MNKGLESLKAAVLRDTQYSENCFSENGCTKERYKDVPEDNPLLISMGIKTKCVAQTKCNHDYCGKYKWVIERAKHYAEKTGQSYESIIEAWENDRSYWYMNYYQDLNQPLLTSEKIITHDHWIKELVQRFGSDAKKWAFVCPNCGNVQTSQDFHDNGAAEHADRVYTNCIGRYVKGKGCDWSVNGLLKINSVSVLKDGIVYPVFEMAP